jgi:hypothetical protein
MNVIGPLQLRLSALHLVQLWPSFTENAQPIVDAADSSS